MAEDNKNVRDQIQLFGDLQSLLEEQIELARRSDIAGIEVLAEKANSAVSKIAQITTPEQNDFIGQRQRLTKLYKQLELMLTANKDNIARQLRQTKDTRKTLQAYRNNT